MMSQNFLRHKIPQENARIGYNLLASVLLRFIFHFLSQYRRLRVHLRHGSFDFVGVGGFGGGAWDFLEKKFLTMIFVQTINMASIWGEKIFWPRFYQMKKI